MHFDADGGGEREADAGERHGRRWTLPPQKRDGAEEDQTELQVVVVDRSRQEAEMPVEHREGDEAGEQQNAPAAQRAGAGDQRRGDDQHTDQRPDSDGKPDRCLAAEERRKGCGNRCDRQVHEA